MDFKLSILLEFLILYILMYFWGFLKERLIFYNIFCEGPFALRRYALTVVRELISLLKYLGLEFAKIVDHAMTLFLEILKEFRN